MRIAKAYFFKGGQYVRYDLAADEVESGYPASIGTEWNGLTPAGFASGLDAAVNWGNGKAYFFKGGQYLRYDITTDTADAGYPAPMAGAWPGLAEAGFGTGLSTVLAYEPRFRGAPTGRTSTPTSRRAPARASSPGSRPTTSGRGTGARSSSSPPVPPASSGS